MPEEHEKLKELATKRVSRRTFLMGMAGTAGLGIIGGALASCAGANVGGTPTTTPGKTPAAAPAASSAGSSTKFQGRTLRVMMNGGKYEEVARAAVIEPFEKKYGVNVEITPASSAEMMTRIRAEKSSPTVDFAIIDDLVAVGGYEEGLFEKIDPNNIPNLKNIDPAFLDQAGYGPTVHGVPITFAYNKNLVKIAPPLSWADLWKPDYKDMLAMCSIALTPSLLFLVQAAKMNGGDYDNIDPGFAAIAKLMPNVKKWFHDLAEVRPAVDNDGLIGIMGNSIWVDEMSKGIPLATVVPKEGAPFLANTAQIIKGTKNKDLAEMLIDQYLSEESQLGIVTGYAFTVVNKKVKVPDNLKAQVPDVSQVVHFDPVKIGNNRGAWTERWNKDLKV